MKIYHTISLQGTYAAHSASYVGVGDPFYYESSKFISPTAYLECEAYQGGTGLTGYFGIAESSGDTVSDTLSFAETAVTASSYTRYKSASFSLTNGKRYNFVAKAPNTDDYTYIKRARLVIVDDVGESTPSNYQTIIDLLPYHELASTSYTEPTKRAYYYHDTSNFDGTLAYYLEAGLSHQTAGGTAYLELYDLTDSAAVASSAISVTDTTRTRVRSSAISLTNGHFYTVRLKSSSGSWKAYSDSARLIVNQSGSITKTATMVFGDDGSANAAWNWTTYTSTTNPPWHYYIPEDNEYQTLKVEADVASQAGNFFLRAYNKTDSDEIQAFEIAGTNALQHTEQTVTGSLLIEKRIIVENKTDGTTGTFGGSKIVFYYTFGSETPLSKFVADTVASSDVANVMTTTNPAYDVYCLMYGFQRKIFYDATSARYWAFYIAPSTKYIKYTSKEANSTLWTTGVAITSSASLGEDFAVWVSGGAAYIIYTQPTVNVNMYYRKITLNADGSVSLGTIRTYSLGTAEAFYKPSICLTSDNYPVISYIRRDDTATGTPYVFASANSGAWSNGENIYINDAKYASSKTNAAAHTAYGFSCSIPTDATITQVVVEMMGYTAGDEQLDIEVSKDGGSNWSAAQRWTSMPTSNNWADFDFSSSYAYTPANFNTANNFRVRFTNVQVGASMKTNYVDSVSIYVGYTSYAYTPYVSKFTSNDGTLTEASGYPIQLKSTTSTTWRTQVIPLSTAGRYAALYFTDGTVGRVKTCSSGSTLNSELATTSNCRYAKDFCAVSLDGVDDFYLVYQTMTGDYVKSSKYLYASNTFDTEADIVTNNTEESAFPTCWNNGTTKLIMFLVSSNTIKAYTYDGASWTNENVGTDDSIDARSIQCTPTVNNGRIVVFYGNLDSTYTVQSMDYSQLTVHQITDTITLTDLIWKYPLVSVVTDAMSLSEATYLFKFPNVSTLFSNDVSYDDTILSEEPQTRTLYAGSWFYVFWWRKHFGAIADSHDIKYSYSSSGETWAAYLEVMSRTVGRPATAANGFSIVKKDENTIFVAYNNDDTYALALRSGAINADGTITWTQYAIDSATGVGASYHVTLEIDSEGYPCVGYCTESSDKIKFIKATAKDGSTWGSDNPPSTAATTRMLTTYNITGNKLLGIWENDAVTPKVIRWAVYDGSTDIWGAAADLNKTLYLSWNACVDSTGKVYLFYRNYDSTTANYDLLVYRTYTYAGGWSGETVVESDSTYSTSYLNVTIDRDRNRVYFLYPSTTSLYCRILTAYGLGPRQLLFTEPSGYGYMTVFADRYTRSNGDFTIAWQIQGATVKQVRATTYSMVRRMGVALTDDIALTDLATKAGLQFAITDTLALAEAMLAHKGLNVTDPYALSDVGKIDKSLTGVSDVASLVDSAFRNKTFSITETLSFVDAVLAMKTLNVTEAIALADAIIRHKSLPLTETISSTDTPLAHKGLKLTDNHVLSDVGNVNKSLTGVSDVASLVDAVVRNKSLPITETVSLVDALMCNKSLPITDSTSLSDAVLAMKTLNVTEAIALAEALVNNKSLPITDVIALVDAVISDKYLSILETILLTDEFAGKNWTITDSITLLDSLVVHKVMSVTDAVTVLDAIVRNRMFQITDGVSLVDVLIGNRSFSITDVITLVEQLSMTKALLITESVTATDLVSRNVGLMTIVDGVAITDVVSLRSERIIAETIAMSDEPSAPSKTIVLGEGIHLSSGRVLT